jgi:acetyl/propionyl-CoA carboxylase alpha subunit
VPGTEGEGSLGDEELFIARAGDRFSRCLIKATAGGGGKGMREVNREEMPALLQSARREAERPLAMATSTWKSSSRTPATSRSRSWQTATAT